MSKAWDGTIVISKHINACHLEKVACRLKDFAKVTEISMRECRKKKWKRNNTRRVNDFSIVGAHQACNHSCPTYCVDTYEPACAQIWNRGMKRSNLKVMINHCHIDLFSCAVGVNVTIVPLGKCYKNPLGMAFMTQMASMKSMGLLEPVDENLNKKTGPVMKVQGSRRSSYGGDNSANELEMILRKLLSKCLWDILRKN